MGDSGYVIVNTPIGNLGIGDEPIVPEVLIYPNPTEDIVHIESKDLEGVAVEIVDLNGKVLKSNIVLSQYAHSINMSEFDAGIYLLRSKDPLLSNYSYRIIKR